MFRRGIGRCSVVGGALRGLTFKIVCGGNGSRGTVGGLLVRSNCNSGRRRYGTLVRKLGGSKFLVGRLGRVHLTREGHVVTRVAPLYRSLGSRKVTFRTRGERKVRGGIVGRTCIATGPGSCRVRPKRYPFGFCVGTSVLGSICIDDYSVCGGAFLVRRSKRSFVSNVVNFRSLELFPFVAKGLIAFECFWCWGRRAVGVGAFAVVTVTSFTILSIATYNKGRGTSVRARRARRASGARIVIDSGGLFVGSSLCGVSRRGIVFGTRNELSPSGPSFNASRVSRCHALFIGRGNKLAINCMIGAAEKVALRAKGAFCFCGSLYLGREAESLCGVIKVIGGGKILVPVGVAVSKRSGHVVLRYGKSRALAFIPLHNSSSRVRCAIRTLGSCYCGGGLAVRTMPCLRFAGWAALV